MKGTVLLVEDNENIRKAFAHFLDQEGYKVVEACSVRTGLMHLDIIDLKCVVLDLRLPNGHGRQIVEELKAKRDDVPVVITSAYHDDSDWEFPVVRFLRKPTLKKDLVAAVNEAVAGYATWISDIRDSTRRIKDLAQQQ